MPDSTSNANTDYINSTDYTTLSKKIDNLADITNDLTAKSLSSRKLRYAEINIEAERKSEKIAPDEMYVPQHIIDTNIRREQSSYVQYITQSPRAIVLKDRVDPANDLTLLEVDLTEKLRFDGWQMGMYANIDGFQANGYGVMETTQDQNNPGEIGREYVQYGDFAFIADTRDLQKVEMIGRSYYFTKTKLKTLTEGSTEEKWDITQVNILLGSEPNDEGAIITAGSATSDKSLYKVMKVMFKVKGVVQVGWCCPKLCTTWLRAPRPLFLGRRSINEEVAKAAPTITKILSSPMAQIGLQQIRMSLPKITDAHIEQVRSGLPPSDPQFETQYPYFLYPYLISENDTIACLKGRVFLDQNTQNAATSLMSSTLTQARRAAGLYFSKDTTDPNDDFLMQKNVHFKTGAIINGKLKEMRLDAPAAQMFSAINLLISANQQETSQVNFAEVNRQEDSRKTATAVKASMQMAQQLSGVQVTLFSIAIKNQYTYECDIIKSRVLTGLLKVSPVLQQLYARDWTVKPSGDTDVIQRQQLIQTMQQAWPVYQNTPAAMAFLSDMTELLFPDRAPKYLKAFQDAQAQQSSQQAAQQQQLMQIAQQTAQSIIQLSKHPEFFSETGTIHALPVVQQAADKFEQMMQPQK